MDELFRRWDFEPTEELPGGHCSRVFADSTRVLKVPFQGEEQVSGWPAALVLASVVGPPILESDPHTGALLMSRALPGTPLHDTCTEEAARQIVAGHIRQIQSLHPDPSALTLDRYYSQPSPARDDLLRTSPPSVFLHGDLHHENILAHGDDWWVIDPKGLVGDPNYEAIAFLRNPLTIMREHPDLEGLLRDRLQWFGLELGLDPQRMLGWLYVDMTDHPGTRPPDDPWVRLEAVVRGLWKD